MSRFLTMIPKGLTFTHVRSYRAMLMSALHLHLQCHTGLVRSDLRAYTLFNARAERGIWTVPTNSSDDLSNESSHR